MARWAQSTASPADFHLGRGLVMDGNVAFACLWVGARADGHGYAGAEACAVSCQRLRPSRAQRGTEGSPVLLSPHLHRHEDLSAHVEASGGLDSHEHADTGVTPAGLLPSASLKVPSLPPASQM